MYRSVQYSLGVTVRCVLVVMFCICLETSFATEASLSKKDRVVLKELEDYVHASSVTLGNCPTALVVSRNGEMLLEKYAAGIDGAEPLGPVNEESLWPIYSSTKSYVAGLLLSLATDGVLALDDPVSKYLPAFLTHGDGTCDRRKVTIRHLASHMSGASLPEGKRSGGLPDLNLVTIETPPGEVFRYSGLGMHILECVIETAAAADLEALLKARILDPLGLRDTRYLYALDASLPMLPVNNAATEDPSKNYALAFKGYRASSGLYATARNCNRFGQLWLGDGTLEGHTYFTPELKLEAWKYHGTRYVDKGRYGLLWWLFEDDGGYVISGAGEKVTAVAPKTGVVITVLRLPLKPRGPFNFKEDKRTLVRFGNRLGK